MFDHVALHVTRLDVSTRFFTAVLAPLGFELGSQAESYVGFGPKDAPAFWLYFNKERKSAHAHLAFRAPTREAVDQFYKAGLKAGGKDNGGPGVRPDYGPNYYAAFLIDPDGHNVEAVCLK